jgi:hypothetical protein
MSKEQYKAAVHGIHESDGKPDIVILSAEINRELYLRLSDKLGDKKRAKACCTVFLNTAGGDPHAAFRIARCLRFHYKKVRLVVPHYCKSAGTLIAVGADTLVIGDKGELGPLDVQIMNRKEIFERSSGLDYTEALHAMQEHALTMFRQALIEIRAGAQVSTKMAGEFASQLSVGAVAPMYGQIDPIQVGEVHRAMKIAYVYAERLNKQSKQLEESALAELVNGYPDHSFVIDRKEAENLFKSVQPMTEKEQDFVRVFWAWLKDETDQCIVLDQPQPKEADNGSVSGLANAASAEAEPTTGAAGIATVDGPPGGDGGGDPQPGSEVS